MPPIFCHFVRGQNRDGGDEALPVEAVDLFLTQDFRHRSAPCVRLVSASVLQGHQPVNRDWWRTSMRMSGEQNSGHRSKQDLADLIAVARDA